MSKNIINSDGQVYESNDEVWDLGSFIAVEVCGTQRRYEGLSKDIDKLPHYVGTGSSALCLDTGDEYNYLKSTDTWYKLPSGGGGEGSSVGGSGGTTNYTDLSNKPRINNIILIGNLRTEDLGITDFSGDYNDLTNIPKINDVELKGEISLEDLGIIENEGTTNYEDLENKPKINNIELSGNLSLEDLGITESGGTTDYEDLENKPKINGNELSGDLSTEDLGITEFSGDYNDLSNTPNIPTELPSPNSLIFNGIIPERIYNGSKDVEITLPDFEILNEFAGSPVGEIIPYMGNSAPPNYLFCDGTEYSISDYEELANHFIKEFGSVNFFGGDGETTFCVPDLRGEFLRCTGQNSHSHPSVSGLKEGSGASVGVHQTATLTSPMGVSYESSTEYISVAMGAQLWSGAAYADTNTAQTMTNAYFGKQGSNSNKRIGYMTQRPTNTSVLYCIKYKSTYYVKMTNAYPYFTDFSSQIQAQNGITLESKYGYVQNNMVTVKVIMTKNSANLNKILTVATIPEEYGPIIDMNGVKMAWDSNSDEARVTYSAIRPNGEIYTYFREATIGRICLQLYYPLYY